MNKVEIEGTNWGYGLGGGDRGQRGNLLVGTDAGETGNRRNSWLFGHTTRFGYMILSALCL